MARGVARAAGRRRLAGFKSAPPCERRNEAIQRVRPAGVASLRLQGGASARCRRAFQTPFILAMASAMVKNSPFSASAAALLLPLTLAAVAVFAQTAPTDVKEDSVILQPDKVTDDAPVVETLAEANLPSWSKDNASALLD